MRPLAGMAAHRAATLAREVPSTTPTASRASLSVLARRFRADLHEIRLFEGLEPDSWESRPAQAEALQLVDVSATEIPQLVDMSGSADDREPASWPTWTASTERPQLADVDGLDRDRSAGGRVRPRTESLPAGGRGRPRPSVAQLADVDGLDRDRSAGGRVRPRPSVPSWWTWTASTATAQLVDVSGLDREPASRRTSRALTESPQLADVDGLDREAPTGRRGRPRPRVPSWV